LAVLATFSLANPDSQEWLSYETAHGRYGCGPAFSTNLRRPSITAGRVKSSQKMSISRRSSSAGSGLMKRFAAAAVARGRKVAPGVRAWVVPGSETVKREAVAEGLDKLFTDAGFEWREPGCSMCLAANGETVAPGERSVSTSNRNFIGRQGPRARTHLASPAMAAAAAISGAIADVRTLER